jgi:hypothetical protein
MLARLTHRWRQADVRRWIRRQEAQGIDPNAYEIRGYIRGRWPQLNDAEARVYIVGVATTPSAPTIRRSWRARTNG